MEWDSLGPDEKWRRIFDLCGLGLVLSGVGTLVGLPLGVGTYLISHTAKSALLVSVLVSIGCGFALSVLEGIGILRSIARTRLATLFQSERAD